MTTLENLLSIQAKHGFEDDDDDGEEEDGIHPNISSSDEEGELDDDSKHSKLMEAMGSMDAKKRSKVKQRSEPSAEVSEFQLNTKDAQGKGVWIHDLMGALRDTPSHSALKKQMNTINKRKLLPTPLHQHEAEKIQRQMAYQATSKEVSKWDHVVLANRRAENLTFPLNQQVLGLPTTDQFVKKFKPSTPLEQEVYKILHGSKFAERPNKKLTQAEEEAIKAMSLSEARERRSELQKHRALVSFYEAKCRRQKKIKSKKYHRIQRKSKAREESKKIEELMKNDPEAAQETLDKMEKSRATERMSLKHRNTGKWAKTMMRYGRHNISARQELAQQLQKSHELTEKIAEVNGDRKEDEVEVSGGEEEEDGASIQPSLSDINNPWFTGGKAGKTKDGEKEEGKNGEQEGYVALEAVKAAKDDVEEEEEEEEIKKDDEEELDQDHKMLQMIQQERRRWKGDGAEEEEIENDSESSEDDTEVDRSPKARKGKQSAKEKRTAVKKKKMKKKIIKVMDEDKDGIHSDGEEEGLDEGLERRQTHSSLEDQEWLLRLEEEKNISELKSVVVVEDETRVDKNSAKTSSSNVDPGKVFTVKAKEIRSLEPELVEEGEGSDDGERERRQHRMNIQQAFADDDVVEEFKEEKKAKVERDKPKDVDLTLPGWGDWGGVGVQPSKKRRKRFIIKAPPQAPRRDAKLPNVIINENRDKKIAMHQVNSLPFPFSSTDQFERSIRAPVGPTWNTPSAVKALTCPKLTTKIGTIIPPIQAEETFKGKTKGGKKRQGDHHQQGGKRKGPRPDIVLDDGNDDQKRQQKRRRKGKGK